MTDGIANLTPDPHVELLGETVLWKGAWRSMLQRAVTLPGAAKEEVKFDVVASNHGDESVLVLAWDTRTRTATLIREYHPGPNEWQYGVVAGGFEGKHDSPLDAGRSELEEEARLVGGSWTSLLIPREEEEAAGGGVTTVSHDKYTTNRFHAFLAVDCERVEEGKARDDEESIRVVHGVTAAELRHLVRTARLNVPSSYAILLALDALREMGLIS